MSAIGPGDFVECVNNRTASGPSSRLKVGAIYRVAAVGVTPPDDEFPNAPWVALFDPPPAPGKLGFHAKRFKPVYRPNSDFINSLKQPAPDFERELVGAD